MYLIVGLGNPGEEYEHTRHNAGFDTLDIVAQDARVTYWKTKCGSLVGEGKISFSDGSVEEVVLAKPQSFMNLSGGPVSLLSKEYGIKPDHIIVIHDELDIAPGTIRVKMGGGHAGHNGLRSICDKLGTRDFLRMRVGIGRPPGRMKVADYVLSTPKKDDFIEFDQACVRAAEATKYLIEHGLEKTQQEYN